MDEISRRSRVLKNELKDLYNSGVKFTLEGRFIECGDNLFNTLLREDGCTYMRNYAFFEGRLVRVDFDKVELAN